MGGGPWQGIFLQTGTKSKVNEASQKRSLEFGMERIMVNRMLKIFAVTLDNFYFTLTILVKVVTSDKKICYCLKNRIK